MFEIEPGLIIWTSVSFAILVFFLYRFLLPPLLNAVEKREKQISLSIDSANKAKKDAEDLLLSYKQKLEESHKIAGEILERSKAESQSIIKEAADRAKQEAQMIITQSRMEIESSRKRMIDEVRLAGADLIISASSKILGREVTQQDNKRVIAESLDEIGKI